MDTEMKIQALEQELKWTREDAESCGCNVHPHGPCASCWALGWGIAGIEIEAHKEEARNV